MSTILSMIMFPCLLRCAAGAEVDKPWTRDILGHMLRLERTVMELSWKLNISSTRTAELENKMKKLSVAKGKNKSVAFEVRQMKNPLKLGDGEILKFDHVTLNAGNSYNANTGNLIAPVDGTYFFWANVMSRDSTVFVITLQKEGREIARGYTGYSITHGIATITHIVQLKKGDHIWFENDPHSGSVSTVYGTGYSSYGGTLL